MTDWKSVVVPLVVAVALGSVIGWALGSLLKVWYELAWMAVR